MTTPAMRTIPRLRANHALRLQTTTPSRTYSSLRPLTHTTSLSTPRGSTRPTLPPSRPRHQVHPRRAFSLLPLLETSLSASHTLLTTLHTTTCTPWYLTIPLFALTLNLVTRLPTTIYSRRVAVRRQHLQPLVPAWSARVSAEMAADRPRAGSGSPGQGSREWMRGFVKGNMRAMKERERRWGVQRWKDWVPGVAVFPFWVVGIESLRRMCGGPRGLLGSVLFGRGGQGEGGKVAAATSSGGGGAAGERVAAAGGEGVVVGGQGLGQVHGATGSGLEVDLSSLGTAQETVARYVADQSMATGGCLWFPDLTAADPLHILPFALSAILVLNVLPKSMVSLRVLLGLDSLPEAAVGGVKWRLRLQRGLLMVAMAVGPITMDLPAALHLYWISSAALTKAQTSIIHKLMPLPNIVPPAKKEQAVLIMPTREHSKEPNGKR